MGIQLIDRQLDTEIHALGVVIGMEVEEPILDKAAQFGYQGVMLVAKRPHASVLDMDGGARKALRLR